MIEEKFQRYKICFAFLIFILFCFSFLFSIVTPAQEEKILFIVINDSETNLPIEEDIFLEGKRYDIAIGCIGEYGYEYNVTISVPWDDPYLTSEELPWITIKAPDFGEYPDFVISAMKEGYGSIEQEISVLKGELFITTDRGTIHEKNSFSVTVWDQNNNKIEGATVYLDIDGFKGDSDDTGSNGIAYLIAPEVSNDVKININVIKGGYFPGSTSIRVENNHNNLFIGGLTPIIAALVFLVFSMVFVRIKKEISKPTAEIKINNHKENTNNDKVNFTNKITLKKELFDTSPEEKFPELEKGPWVEEIRIDRPDKKKKTKYILAHSEKVISKHKNDENEWFKGKENVKFKIDKLTGDIDEQNEDKWFEGVYDIKSKVNKKLKKNSKKKNKSK